MITSIAISNYKSISNLPPLRFGQISFLIGKNGAGKSNLISAIELTRSLCAGANFKQAASQIAPFGIELFTRGLNKPSSSITMGVRDKNSNRYELTYTISTNDNEFVITNEKLVLIENDKKQEIYVRKPGSFKARKALSDQLSDVPLSIKDDELALANFNNENAMKVSRLISNFSVLWFDKTAAPYEWRVHRQGNFDTSNLDGLAISLHENDPMAFKKAVAVVRQIIPEFVAPKIERLRAPTTKNNADSDEGKSLDKYFVFWGEKESHEIEYTLSGLSDGNFRIIQLVFAMFNAKGSSCVIGEEIENGQHYGRIKTLMEVLRHLAIKLNVQLLFSTHSLDLLDEVSSRDVIFCSKDEDGYSLYRKLEDAVNVDMVKAELGREPTARELIDIGV